VQKHAAPLKLIAPWASRVFPRTSPRAKARGSVEAAPEDVVCRPRGGSPRAKARGSVEAAGGLHRLSGLENALRVQKHAAPLKLSRDSKPPPRSPDLSACKSTRLR